MPTVVEERRRRMVDHSRFANELLPPPLLLLLLMMSLPLLAEEANLLNRAIRPSRSNLPFFILLVYTNHANMPNAMSAHDKLNNAPVKLLVQYVVTSNPWEHVGPE